MATYELIEKVGEGTFGKVFKAVDNMTGELVAVKILKEASDPSSLVHHLPEVQVLSQLRHPNIVTLKDVGSQTDGNQVIEFLVFEYMSGSLGSLIRSKETMGLSFSETEIRSYCFQVLQGLAYMHRCGFMHRDLKPDNLLVSDELIKISDLGTATELKSYGQESYYVTTRTYRAPEMLMGSLMYDDKVDMWAFGVIMAELFLMRPLFRGQNTMEQLCCIMRGCDIRAELPDASDEAIDLMESLVALDPSQRLSAFQALQHPFFKRGQLNGPQAQHGFSFFSYSDCDPPIARMDIFGRCY